MHEPGARIHRDNPFVTPVTLRDPVRRFRGHLAAPVTVWTAGGSEARAGLTVGSLLVMEGEPDGLLGLLNPLSDLLERVRETGSFVVHILEEEHRELAERFAGIRPSPGGLFRGVRVEDSEWGPVLSDLKSRAFCSLLAAAETGYHVRVEGQIEKVELGDIEHPLVHFRGLSRALGPRWESRP